VPSADADSIQQGGTVKFTVWAFSGLFPGRYFSGTISRISQSIPAREPRQWK
jgi:ABC-type polysaccharide/polyol phosphate export permease